MNKLIYRITTILLILLMTALGGCKSQTEALKEEMKTSTAAEAVETSEPSETERLTAEAQETEISSVDEIEEIPTEDDFMDADAWGAEEEDGEDLSRYEEKVSTEKGGTKENYYTDEIPEGKPQPVEPQDEEINKDKSLTCTLSVECSTILNNMGDLTEGKESLVPSDGVIFSARTVTFYEGESVFDLLKREMQNNRIHMESEFTAMYNSAYIEGINNLYEFDCGSLSGWMYCVNDWYPNYGCSRYQIQEGDVIEWHYTCDLGRDLGADMS